MSGAPYDAIVLPGGGPGAQKLASSEKVITVNVIIYLYILKFFEFITPEKKQF